VALKISYLLMRWLFGLVALMFRGDRAKDAELLVLRPGTCNGADGVLRTDARLVDPRPCPSR